MTVQYCYKHYSLQVGKVVTFFIQIALAKKIMFEDVKYNWHFWVLGYEEILTLFWAAWYIGPSFGGKYLSDSVKKFVSVK